MRYMRLLQAAALTLSLLGLVAFIATIGTPMAQAQADLGSCSGVVTDATGAVIPDAQVTLTNVATGAVRTTVTNSKGEYAVTQLLPATYSVKFEAPGFSAASQNLMVTVGSANTMNVKLAVAGGSTQILVAADDFAGVHLEKPEMSAVIQTDQIQSLPTLDRNPYNLVAFSGNLTQDPNDTSGRGVGFNISGARSTSVDILLDGAENTDLYAVGIGQTVPMDATSEIRIVTSNSGAEYGRGSGAVNVSTKSGSNGFHGSIYEFNRISTLASDGYQNNYYHAMYGTPAKPRYTHNQFGYSVGGPIKKDKLFFFSSTEWTRIRSAQNVVSTVPTTDFIAMTPSNMQDFFSTYGKLAHPINGNLYTGASQAVQSAFGPDIVAIALAEEGLAANTKVTGACSDPQISNAPICTTNLFGESIYQVPIDSGGGFPVNQWITFNRADWTINQTTSLFVRYIQQSTVNPPGSNSYSAYEGYNTGVTQFNHNLELSFTKAITSNLASATKVLATRFNQSQPLGTVPVSPTLYVNSGSPVTLGAGQVTFPGYLPTSPGAAIPFGGPQNFIQVGEDLAWTKGKHQFTFGGNFLYIKDNRTFGAYEDAIDALVQTGTKGALKNFVAGGMGYLNVAIDPKGAYPCYKDATGNYIYTSSCEIQMPATSPNFSRSNRYQDGAAYVADAWKISPKLTFNYGVRWELYGPQHSQKAAYDANFFPNYSAGNPWDSIREGQILTRQNSPDGRLWNLNKKQFAPKVGFAYDPIGNGKTSIRGGYGLSYERNFNNVTFNVIQNPPNYGVVAFTSADNSGSIIPVTTNNFAQFGTGTGLKPLPNVTLRAVDPRIKPSYSSNWSVSIEHQFAPATASISYVGTRGIHNYSIANVNRSFDGAIYEGDSIVDETGAVPQLISGTGNRTNYQYSNINWRGADGDSYYHGVTGELRSADLWRTGLNVRADYTFSHSIDNGSSTFDDSNNEGGGGLVLGYTDPWNKAFDRGNSDFDVKHRVASAIVWTVPYAKSTTGLTRTLLDNWTLSTTFDAQTGAPFTMFDGYYAVNVYPRATFAQKPPRAKTGGMTDLSSIYGANTYSYIHLPDYYDSDGNPTANYINQVNPVVSDWYNAALGIGAPTGTPIAGSDVPICSGVHGVGCSLTPGMDGRNAFRGPGSWHENFGIVKDFKVDHERYDIQLKGEFINIFNHANTYLSLAGANDVESYTDVLANKTGNRNTELSLHIAF